MISVVSRNARYVLGCVLLVLMVASASAQTAPASQAGGSGLVGMLTQKLHVTPAQAQAGAGAIFSYAKQHMNPAQFQKISSYVPNMDQLMGAAPAPAANATGSAQSQGTAAESKADNNNPASALGQITGGGADASKAAGSAAAGAAGGAVGAGSGLMSLGSSFQSIGLSPDMATKFAPVMQQYLASKGGPGVASSFASAVGLGGGQ
jgi:hypothetical protein